jgi:hypothetical protein
MCVFSKPAAPTIIQAPAVTPAPAIAPPVTPAVTEPAAPPPPAVPTPSPTPTTVQQTESAEGRRSRVSKLMQFGLQSTIRTSPQGVVGPGPNLFTPAAGGKKTKTGQ